MTTPDPFAGVFDGDVLEWAVAHLRRAADFPLGSHLSKREWLKFSAAMAELDREADAGARARRAAPRADERHVARPAGG